ncbi:hypothetical protein ACFQ0B_45860 [Nonomuraea thailandensis]
MKRATLEHFDAGPALGDIKKIWGLLPRGLRGNVAPLAQLWPLLSRHFLASHLFAGRPVRRDLVLDPDGLAPSRASLEVRGELGEARLLDVVDSVTGRIMLALRSVGISWGGSNNLALGLMNSLADSDDGGTTSDSGTLKLPSRSRIRAITTALVAIFGTEFLGISVARKYRFQVPVDVEVKLRTSHAVPTGHHAGGWKSRMLHSPGNGLFTVPEHDALRMYADGELSLPLPVLADAVERFLNGSMNLHRTLAVPLVMRYVKARGDALSRRENLGIGAGHTPAKLLEALKKVADLGETFAPAVAAAAADPLTAWSGLENALSEAKDVNDRLKHVVVAPQYENGMGVSLPQAFDVTDGQGNPVNLMDVVLSAVDAAVPGAVRAHRTCAGRSRTTSTTTRRRSISTTSGRDGGWSGSTPCTSAARAERPRRSPSGCAWSPPPARTRARRCWWTSPTRTGSSCSATAPGRCRTRRRTPSRTPRASTTATPTATATTRAGCPPAADAPTPAATARTG